MLPPEAGELLLGLGIAQALMLIVEILKRLGAIPDGMAGKIVSVGQVVAYCALLILGVFEIDLSSTIQAVTSILISLFTVILEILSALLSFGVLRRAQVFNPLPSRS